MTQVQLRDKSLSEISILLQNNLITSEELVNFCFERIEKYDHDLGAFLFTNKQSALAQARESDKRRKEKKCKSPLDGIVLAVKDIFLQERTPTTAASKILQDYYPCYNSTAVQKLLDDGAIIIGKLNMDEFAMGSSNENSAYKICKNPWDLSKTPGGSSGGSASSVAAALCFGSLGTDTGGSIRQPASFCSTVGIKPTYGRVSRFGVVAFASSLDQVGPIAGDVKSAAMLLQSIAGHDKRDSTSADIAVDDYVGSLKKSLAGTKIGVPYDIIDTDGIDDDVKKTVKHNIDALKDLGAEIYNISLPHSKYAVATYYIIATAEASSNLSRYDGIRYGKRLASEQDLAQMYEKTRGNLFGPEVKRRIMLGSYVLSAGYYDAYYLRAQKIRNLIAGDFKEAFKKVDAIVMPTSPTPAFDIGDKINDPIAMYLNDIYTISVNLAGLPAMSMPGGFSSKKLPIGTQIIADGFCEGKMLQIGYALEQHLNLNNTAPLP